MPRASDMLACALVAAAASLPYLNSLDGKFAYDDKVSAPFCAHARARACVAPRPPGACGRRVLRLVHRRSPRSPRRWP